IAEGLASQSDVRVLCSQPTYASRGIRAPRLEERNGVKILRCRSTALDRTTSAFRLINMLTIAGSMLYTALVSVKRLERVLVVTNPPVLPFIAAVVCWLKGARLLLLVHDVYPDALIAAGLVRRGTSIDGLLQWFSRR